MTDAQTEARALLETAGARFPEREDYDAAVAVIATALAAKDAELAVVRADLEFLYSLDSECGSVRDGMDLGRACRSRAERAEAALAAKDAELAAQLAETQRAWNERDGEKRLRLRAEAQLAEANKALERIEATAKDKSEKAWYRLETIADEAHFARRAREAQGGQNV